MTRRTRSGALIAALACIAAVKADAEPLLTISCDPPKGFNIEYGASVSERLESRIKNQPLPPPKLTGPIEDGYISKPTFVIDADRKKVTAIWAEPPKDVEERKRLEKQLALPPLPPPPASEANIVSFTGDQISAIELDDPWSIVTYSFFPRLGTAFINEQTQRIGTADIQQMSTFAHCDYSWTHPQ